MPIINKKIEIFNILDISFYYNKLVEFKSLFWTSI
ncbi:MAG: hypothetical protein Satyrvirus32_4 [Satyrvirus sp.]|uniref:Uncharacterized protein n=1 Tax=Satyrvirus sp. TaxID=2487771 RepID=A0A3G5AGH8_9VIRU|nr:MAG: hypothetical protein Satyrvirus32_4 [Satyrvirus sp.]